MVLNQGYCYEWVVAVYHCTGPAEDVSQQIVNPVVVRVLPSHLQTLHQVLRQCFS